VDKRVGGMLDDL